MHFDPGNSADDAVDAADAWRRARRYLPGDGDQPVLLHVQEFKDGFQVVLVSVDLPEPPPAPSIETATTLVVDKITGAVTRWPLLKLDVLANQYSLYRRDKPLTFDEPTQ